MRLDINYACDVFTRIKLFREFFRENFLAGDGPLDWQRVAHVASVMYGVKVKIVEVPVPSPRSSLHGTLLRYEGTAAKPHKILIKEGLSDEQKNFVITKELCHIIIDSDVDYCPFGVDVIRGIGEQYILEQNGETESLAHRSTQSENYSIFAAVELLYFYEARKYDIERRKVPETFISIRKIALHHRIPAHIVDRALRQSHMDFCDYVWSKVST